MDDLLFRLLMITVVAVGLTAISIVLIRPSWKSLKAALQTLPVGYRKIFFNLRGVTNRRLKAKLEDMFSLFWACILFGLNILLNLASLFGAISILSGLSNNIKQDYAIVGYCTIAGIWLFAMALFLMGSVRFGEAVNLARGKVNPLDFSPTTPEEQHEYALVLETALGLKAALEKKKRKRARYPLTRRQTEITLGLIFTAVLAIVSWSDLEISLCLRITIIVVSFIVLIALFLLLSRLFPNSDDDKG